MSIMNGPWKWIGDGRDADSLVGPKGSPILTPVSGWDKTDLGIRFGEWKDPDNGKLIRNAIEHLPELLADAERYKRERNEAVAMLKTIQDVFHSSDAWWEPKDELDAFLAHIEQGDGEVKS